MQENQPVVNQLFSKPINQEEPVKIQKPNNFLTILLSILLFISLTIAGYFVYQTQELAKELQEFRNQELATPTSAPTFEPGTEPEQIPLEVLTKDWKTYTNDYWEISFKYPDTLFKGCQNYTTEKEGIRFWGPNFGCQSGHDIFYKIGFVGYDLGKYFEPKKPVKTENIIVDGKQALKKYYIYDEQDGPASGIKQSIEIVINLDNGIIVLQQLGIDINEQKAFDQMLSTFKFIN